ncbi:hypothetical protein HD806DRAFT_524815 [Xylariaceae sp. AK1471]|nr:hypothetical protein HD806DRAFT_524815 [Xylariaceae sp. AK1471]
MSPYLNWSAWNLESAHARSWLFGAMMSLLLYAPISIAIRRRRGLNTRGGYDSLKGMTLEEAYAIKSRLAEQEFPMVFSAAIGSVFFKAEGIPSIAKLIARVAQRSSSSSASRAAGKHGSSVTPADLLGRPGAPETKAAIDRVNYIHSLYRPSGKMSDDDLLYVLSLWPLEVIRWVEKYEYRSLTLEERCALATLWKSLGEELRIPYENLPSCREGLGFENALHWLKELGDWSRAYEDRNLERSPESVFLAEKNMDNWVGGVPGFLKPAARSLLAVIIEPRVRLVMDIPTPPMAVQFIVHAVIRVRKLLRGYSYSPMRLLKGYERA